MTTFEGVHCQAASHTLIGMNTLKTNKFGRFINYLVLGQFANCTYYQLFLGVANPESLYDNHAHLSPCIPLEGCKYQGFVDKTFLVGVF